MKIKTTLLAILVAVALFSSQPTSCAAAGLGRAFAAAAVMLQPAPSEAGVMDQLCSHVTSFLDDEADKAAADLKSCKKNCNWKKHKNDLLISAKKKAKDSCSKGEAPDVQELSKGLDRNTKDRLKTLYDNNSRMFDGTAKLKAVDFNAASSKDATLTGKTAALGKGGQVTDLKSAEPTTPKLNAATEFSLSGTQLSNSNSGLSATKQPSVLLASTASATISTNTAFASSGKSALTAAGAAASAKTAASATAEVKSEWDYESCAACLKAQPGQCFGICCKEQPNKGWCQTYCGYGNQVLPPEHEDYPEGNAGYCNCCKQYNSNCYVPYYCPSGGNGVLDKIKAWWKNFINTPKTIKDWILEKYHEWRGEKPCGGGYYKVETQCCTLKNTIAYKCGGDCPDPDTEYCENQKICEKTCSAGVISAVPAPVNGEVILAIGETARLTISGEKGDALGWWASGGTLTPSANNKQATLTSMEPGKITVTFGSKTCSKCRTSIVVSFVKVTSIEFTSDYTLPIFTGDKVGFIVTTEPSGPAYMKLVEIYYEPNPEYGIAGMPPLSSVILISKSDKGTFTLQFTMAGALGIRAKAGKYDTGIPKFIKITKSPLN